MLDARRAMSLAIVAADRMLPVSMCLQRMPYNNRCHVTTRAGTIQDLGQFYMKNGQRARMSTTAGQALLKRLDAAAVSLPP